MKQIRYDNGEGGVEFGHRSVWLNDESETLGYFEALKKDILLSIDALLASGRKVILIYPVPEAGWDVLQRMNTIYIHKGRVAPGDASTSYANYLKRNADSIAVLDGIPDNPRLVRIKPSEMFCNSGPPDRCVTQIDGKPLYFDDNHLSTAGADLIMKQVIPNISR